MEYKKYFNIFFVISLFILLVSLGRRIIYFNKDILILINIIDIFSIFALLLLLNKKPYIGMCLYIIFFITYISIVFIYLPERIFKPTTTIRLMVTIFLIYQVFFGNRRIKRG